jgi:uncharacterized membrane protein
MITAFSSLSGLLSASSSPWRHWPFGPSLTGGWLLALTKFVFIGLVLALILWLLRWAFGPGGRFRDQEDEREQNRQSKLEAMDILRRRLAQGEISPDEFEDRKKLLDSDDD